jgi:hypothetical protein
MQKRWNTSRNVLWGAAAGAVYWTVAYAAGVSGNFSSEEDLWFGMGQLVGCLLIGSLLGGTISGLHNLFHKVD